MKPERSGVYVAPQSLGALRAAAARAGLAWLELEAGAARDKARFLAACAQGLGFPDWFGSNWDALADCLGDFGWRPAPGYVISWRGSAALANAAPDDFAAALEIFRHAATYWKQRGVLFLVLLDEAPASVHVLRLAGT